MLTAMRRRIFFSLCIAMATISSAQLPHYSKDTTFAVLVTWDDAYKTPTTGAYVEAHSFNVNGVSEKSFVLRIVKPGQYEAALPPGVYDVFVSEASSMPRSKRVLINEGGGPVWSLMLEHDDIYLQKSGTPLNK